MKDNTRILKVAITIDRRSFFSWQKEVVEQIQKTPNIQLAYAISDLSQDPPQKNPLFWKLISKLDNKLFNPHPYALVSRDFANEFSELPIIEFTEDGTSKQITEQDLDVLIDLTDSVASKKLAKYAKYGVWFLTHCDLENVNKKPIGIWEMIQKHPKSVAVLRYIKDGMDFPLTIDTTSSCTDILSFKRNINSLLWQSHLLIINNLRLLSINEALFQKKLTSFESIFSNKNITVEYEPPKNGTIVKYALSLYSKKLIQQIRSIFYFNQWALIFLNTEGTKDPFNLSSYIKILPPKDRFWADPFLIKEKDKYYLFIEELIYKNKLGHLSVMEIAADGSYKQPKTILVKDYHLSYPFVFKDNGDYYMIPETSGNKDIQLYKAKNFPLEWELHQTLMTDVVAVDTTIYKENDTYWMFTSQKNHKGTSKNAELFLYSSNTLNSTNWKPHPLNPIVRNIETARPAGAIFQKDGQLFRSSQVCSHHYGYGLNIIEITQLSSTEYEENVELRLLPNWDQKINAVHTFNKADDLYISDIKLKRSRFL
ncbi:glucosamine inositolphosphorylceramide transferase family protein [Winogradskyella tangerina]|uniref:glucosamine inositolphosphorylceramide transferase family protein n=1 Tax=Winogradskyella tangerina TaxID=2023240 RepID=UPI000DBE7709|nr:hypothetical protein [Winogradskyella tangerina]